MMHLMNTVMILSVVGVVTAVDEGNHVRRLRHQTVHIPDLFEMSANDVVSEKGEWYETKSAQHATHNEKAALLSEMDIFARLLQSDGSLSLSMPPSGPTPVAPTPPAPVPVPEPAPVPVPVPVPKAPTKIPPAPVPFPTPVAPTDYSCPSYPACAMLGLIGDCCPTPEGVFLDCCSGIVPAPTDVVPPPVPPSPVAPAPTDVVPPPSPVVVVAPSPIVEAPTDVVAPTPTSKSKDSMSSSGSMSSDGSMSSSGSMSSDGSMSSSGSMSSDEGSMSSSGSMDRRYRY